VLLHGIYLGAVFWSIKHGLPAGIAALVVGCSRWRRAPGWPLLGENGDGAALDGFWARHPRRPAVIAPKLGAADGVPGAPLASASPGMVSITLGHLAEAQGRLRGPALDASIQYVGAMLVTLPIAFLTEEARFDWTRPCGSACSGPCFPLSLGAVGLLCFSSAAGR
jgi:hypothetical protein